LIPKKKQIVCNCVLYKHQAKPYFESMFIKGDTMSWKNDHSSYGLVAIWLHWLMAVLVFVLYGLGLWMVDMDYYHPWYHRAPLLHKTLGVAFAVLFLLRLIWRWYNPAPVPLGAPWERLLARVAHSLMYVLMGLLPITGYLISTAEGHSLELLGGFHIPAVGPFMDNQEDAAGLIHEWLAHGLLVTAILHVAAALKHHVLDRDDTLRRMIRGAGDKSDTTTDTTQQER
jgi:cytochrome b561